MKTAFFCVALLAIFLTGEGTPRLNVRSVGVKCTEDSDFVRYESDQTCYRFVDDGTGKAHRDGCVCYVHNSFSRRCLARAMTFYSMCERKLYGYMYNKNPYEFVKLHPDVCDGTVDKDLSAIRALIAEYLERGG